MAEESFMERIGRYFPGGKNREEAAIAIPTCADGPVREVSEGNPVPEMDPPVALLPDKVQKRVDAVIDGSDLNKIRYFLMELIRKNTGIPTPSVEITEYKPLALKATIPGRFKNEASVYQIILKESIKTERAPTDDKTLKIGNLSVEIQAGYENASILVRPNGALEDEDLEKLKDFFEQVFWKEFMVNEHQSINAPQIKALLDLGEKDLVILDGKTLEISIPLEKELAISEQTLESVAIALNDLSDDFSVKYRRERAGCFSGMAFRKFNIRDIDRRTHYSISSDFTDGRLVVKVSGDYARLELDRRFIESMLKYYIHLLSESTIKKKSALASLREMGVLVFEKDPSEKRKTLEELYELEGFVGYDDIKQRIAVDIIYPWEKREQYRAVTSEYFPNVKNVIPNAALFEGPPGTGKTTEAKIIGKYLGYPFIYIPVGKLMTKWYGESEGNLDRVLELAREAAEENGGVIAMIDEIDEIGMDREKSHEATGRMTGVLLKKLDGIEQVQNLLLIGSTNRKDTMDPALLSRFGRQVYFRLPNAHERKHILGYYIPKASEIGEESLQVLEGKSGRDMKNFSEDVARKYMELKIMKNEDPVLENVLLDCLKSGG